DGYAARAAALDRPRALARRRARRRARRHADTGARRRARAARKGDRRGGALRGTSATYLDAVDAVFEALRGGSAFDPTYDRVVVEDLIDLAPPGLDELLGILSITDALGLDGKAAAYDVAIVDTAPTGHALRLLAMPDVALEWVHALMAILLKYRA